ncbi:MAG: DNA polymerase III subunit beta [Bacilli bacterium]|nr:DNA polymerase III subunit beta [Bacilli bacterium]
MKVQIKRELLLSNLNNVSRALSNKPQMPILTGLKLDVKNNFLTLTASNSDISIQTKIEANDDLSIKETGTVVLPGKYFCEIIRKCDCESILIQTFEQNSVKILAEQSTFTLNLLDKSIFPYISFDDSQNFIYIDGINLKQIIRKTAFAASLSESRMVFTGVSFTVDKDKLETIATDSFRLAKKYMKLEGMNAQIRAIIPSKSLDELNKIIEEAQEIIQIHFTQTRALFKYKNILFQTRLVDGNFPNTKSFIPTEFITDIKFNKNDLINAINRASLFASDETSNVIKMTINEQNEIIVSSIASEIGGSLEKLQPIECSKYLNFEAAFSSRNLLDALKAFDSNEITIHFTGEVKPFIITGEYDVNLLQLLMPLRI